jgi:seryl-tRNA synthetase
MIDIKLLDRKIDANEESYFDQYKKSLVSRGGDIKALEEIIELNKVRKAAITEAEQQKAQQNKLSQQIPTMKKAGQDTAQLMEELTKFSTQVKNLEGKAAEIDQKVLNLAMTLPNKINNEVPVGLKEEDNKIIKTVGSKKEFSFKAKEHWEIGEQKGLIDFDRAAKVAGTRFAFLKGGVARLERAVSQFFMDTHSQEHGYTEMIPPYIVNTASYVGTGQFPKFVDQVFHLTDTDYYLISTAEVPVTNYFREEILKEEELPISFCALSPCFRSEAGASGRDTKGLIRQHQFHKVELMTFCHPEKSYEQLEILTSHAEKCLEKLELSYRRMLLCSGDIGFSATKTYDLEVWLPGQQAYREISSCSNFEDFQARRANIRFKNAGGKPQFVHTLNGSGLAVGRTVIAILENYQNEDGSVTVPKALVPYMSGMTVIK